MATKKFSVQNFVLSVKVYRYVRAPKIQSTTLGSFLVCVITETTVNFDVNIDVGTNVIAITCNRLLRPIHTER